MSKLMAALTEVQNQLDSIVADATTFEDSNVSANASNKAGTRVRTGAMEIIKGLKEVRVLVSDMKNK